METIQRTHLEELRRLHIRRLRELEKQAAYAGADVRPEIRLEVQDLQNTIATIDAEIGIFPVPRVLREPVPDFVGREDEIQTLVQVLSQSAEKGSVAAISGVRGMGGVGKTELAHAVAQRAAPFFPGGQILIEMKGATNPLPTDIALQMILRTMGYTGDLPHEISLLQQLYRSTLQRQRVLIIADDAKDATQVKSLIPPYGCALLITSRLRFTLPGMKQIDLRMLPEKEAEQMILSICPRIGASASLVARLCGYLPLALRVCASLLANDDTLRIERYLTHLAAEWTKLKQLRDPDDPDLDVETSLRLSFDSLDILAQDALCQLSVFSSSFDSSAAKAVVQIDDDIEDVLSRLRRRCLLEWDEVTNLYSLHDLIRAFSSTRLGDMREGIWQRYIAWNTRSMNTNDQLEHDRHLYSDESKKFYSNALSILGLKDENISQDPTFNVTDRLWDILQDDLRKLARRGVDLGMAPDTQSLATSMFIYIIETLPRIDIDFTKDWRPKLLAIANNNLRSEYRRSIKDGEQKFISIQQLNEEISEDVANFLIDKFEEKDDYIDSEANEFEESVLDVVDNRITMKMVREYWFDNLSMSEMQIIRMKYWIEIPASFAEIAQALGDKWNTESVRRRHDHIMEKTRQYLIENGIIEIVYK